MVPLTRENFREYLDALENVDSELLRTRFYHKNFAIHVGDQTMDVDGLLEFERSLKALADFHFEVNQIVADESGIAIDAIETFSVLQNAELPNIGPSTVGERWEVHLNVFYELTDGKISTITVNALSAEQVK